MHGGPIAIGTMQNSPAVSATLCKSAVKDIIIIAKVTWINWVRSPWASLWDEFELLAQHVSFTVAVKSTCLVLHRMMAT